MPDARLDDWMIGCWMLDVPTPTPLVPPFVLVVVFNPRPRPLIGCLSFGDDQHDDNAVSGPNARQKTRGGSFHEPAVPERGSVTRRTWGRSDALRLTEPRSHRVVRFKAPMRVQVLEVGVLHEPRFSNPNDE